jgi:hypothetical protein
VFGGSLRSGVDIRSIGVNSSDGCHVFSFPKLTYFSRLTSRQRQKCEKLIRASLHLPDLLAGMNWPFDFADNSHVPFPSPGMAFQKVPN